MLETRLCLAIALPCVLTAAAHAQQPTSYASQQIDVNGDGKADSIRIGNGSVTLSITGSTRAAFKPFLTTGKTMTGGTLEIGSGRAYPRGTVVIATATFGRGRKQTSETLLLIWDKGKLTELAPDVALGTQGRDGEWSREVRATPRGLLLFERRPGVRRCDGKTPYLYPRAYDWKRRKFRPITNLVRIGSSATTLTASTTPPSNASDTAKPASFRVTSASTSRDAAHAGELAPPLGLGDGNLATGWGEGFGGFGRGEFVTATGSLGGARVRAVRIVPGDATSDKTFRQANRLKRVGLVVGKDKVFWASFPTDPAKSPRATYYWIRLPEDVDTRCVTLVVDSVYGKGRGAQTAIAELSVFTDLELTAGGIESALAARVATGGIPGQAAARTLTQRGPAATRALVAELGRWTKKPAAIRRLRIAIAQAGEPSALTHMVDALAMGGLTRDERNIVSRALSRIGAPAVIHLAQRLVAKTSGMRLRLDAAHTLGSIGDASAQAALIAAAGAGSAKVRRAIVTALARRPSVEIGALVAAATQAQSDGNAPREADLWRAVTRMARKAGKPQLTAHAGRAIADRIPGATGYELRYRLFDAAGSLGYDAATAALTTALAAMGDGISDRALQRVAAFALSRNRSKSARALLVTLAGNKDPGTRAEALRGLGGRDDLGADTDATMGKRLVNDSWYNVRRIAASAMARRCSLPLPAAALGGAVDNDKDVGVVRAALTSLVACRATGIADKLLAVASDKKRPPAVREQATNLFAPLGGCQLAAPLTKLFKQFRGEAWSSSTGIRLASAAAGALGALGCKHKGANNTLLRAARDGSFPRIQAAAVTALGRLCPRGAGVIIRRLRVSPNRGVVIAARGASQLCR